MEAEIIRFTENTYENFIKSNGVISLVDTQSKSRWSWLRVRRKLSSVCSKFASIIFSEKLKVLKISIKFSDYMKRKF